MNEDELRAFLESATVGDDASKTEQPRENEPTPGADDEDHSAATPAADPDRRPSFEELMRAPSGAEVPASPRPDTPAAPSAPSSPSAPSAPSQAQAAPAAPATPSQAAPAPPAGAAGDDPELVPLVLPGPTARPAAPPAAPRPAAKPATPPAAPRPAVPAAPAAPVSARTPVEPPPPTAPLPLGIDELLGTGAGAAASAAEPGVTGTGGNGDEYERIAVTGGEKRNMLPWIVTGIGAVVLLIAAVLIVFAVRGNGGSDPTPTAAPTTSEAPTEPSPSDDPDPSPSDPTPTTPAADDAPEVEVGPTGDFPIPAWNLNGQISAKLGWPQYRLEGAANENLVLFGGSLLPQFPDSCAAMREGFGLTRAADGTITVLRPTQTCAAAPELYDQVWGLVAATIPTFKAA